MRATVLAFALLLVAAAPSLPQLSMPQGWTQDPPRVEGTTMWHRTPNPSEAYPTRLFLTDDRQYDESSAISKFRTIRTCTNSEAGNLERAIHICGFVVDRDEQCGTHPMHRFVGLFNLGPPEIVAQTTLYVALDQGYAMFEYDRPGKEFVASGDGEKDDAVLSAVRAWCESLSPLTSSTAAAVSPSVSPVPGDSFDTAIVIHGNSDDEGTRNEYIYIKTLTCGGSGRYLPRGQSLVTHNKKPYDVLQLTCNIGTETRTIYFDISATYGKY